MRHTKKMDAETKTIGINVYELRKGLGFTQESLAKKIHVSVAYLSKVERGERTPSLGLLQRIALQLHVPTHRLLEPAPGKDSNQMKAIKKKMADLLAITTNEKAKLMLKVCQDIHSTK